MKISITLLAFVALSPFAVTFSHAQSMTEAPHESPPVAEKARVFITDSQSWETRGSAGGSGGVFAAESHGGARPQTAEIIKTFGERCPEVVVNNKQDIADYIVLLDHEGGKSILAHRNKVAVFEHVSGDVVMSKSTLSLGGSVQDACDAITPHWNAHGGSLRAALNTKNTSAQAQSTPPAAAPPAVGPKITVTSTPDNADIEIDDNFVGNTPSTIEVASGPHKVAVKKQGFKTWERTIKISGGDVKVSPELEKQSQ